MFLREVYEQLVAAGLVIPKPEPDPPTIPMDYSWAQVINGRIAMGMGARTFGMGYGNGGGMKYRNENGDGMKCEMRMGMR